MKTHPSLLRRIRDWNDNESWERFFKKYWNMIFSSARSKGLSEAEAKDVAQDTLIEVAGKLRTFEYDPRRGTFRGYLMSLTGWRVKDRLRKRQRIERNELSFATDAENAEIHPTLLGESEKAGLIVDALALVRKRVSPRQYQLFDAFAIREWSIDEVTRTFGVTSFQVYKASSRISKIFRERFEYLAAKYREGALL